MLWTSISSEYLVSSIKIKEVSHTYKDRIKLQNTNPADLNVYRKRIVIRKVRLRLESNPPNTKMLL